LLLPGLTSQAFEETGGAVGERPIPVLSGRNVTYYDVHVWSCSKCDICHMSSSPDPESASLVNPDRSRLCEACHKGTVAILPSGRLKSDVVEMANHPIKFSPLDFDPEKVNHKIIIEETRFYVSNDKGKVPLLGESKETAAAECTTCHDPHGKSGIRKLLRIDNSQNGLCLVCHLNY
jgi:predicted CXXCH cytochrome family protein